MKAEYRVFDVYDNETLATVTIDITGDPSGHHNCADAVFAAGLDMYSENVDENRHREIVIDAEYTGAAGSSAAGSSAAGR